MTRRRGNIQKHSIEKIWLKEGKICFVCGKKVSFKDATREHKMPMVLGGTNAITNLAIAHKQCNWDRGNKSIVRRSAMVHMSFFTTVIAIVRCYNDPIVIKEAHLLRAIKSHPRPTWH